MCKEFGCLPSAMENEDLAMVEAVMDCRQYREAARSYIEGKSTKGQADLNEQVDRWRREAEG